MTPKRRPSRYSRGPALLRSQVRNDSPPFNSIISGGFARGIRAGSAPKFGIEGAARGAEIDVPVSPTDIHAKGILAGGVGQSAPGVDQVRYQGSFGAQLRLLLGYLRPIPDRFGGAVGQDVALREIGVGHIDLSIHGIHRPGHLLTFEVFLFKKHSDAGWMLETRTVEDQRGAQVIL